MNPKKKKERLNEICGLPKRESVFKSRVSIPFMLESTFHFRDQVTFQKFNLGDFQ